MENRAAFTGISAEPEESVDEVNWRQNNYNQRGRRYSNRAAFTGISAEPEESVDEVNWRQNNYNQRGRGYSNRGSNRWSYRGNRYPPS